MVKQTRPTIYYSGWRFPSKRKSWKFRQERMHWWTATCCLFFFFFFFIFISFYFLWLHVLVSLAIKLWMRGKWFHRIYCYLVVHNIIFPSVFLAYFLFRLLSFLSFFLSFFLILIPFTRSFSFYLVFFHLW